MLMNCPLSFRDQIERSVDAHRREIRILFLAGPRVREWGFHHPDRWIPWTELEKHPAITNANTAEPDEVTGEMAEAGARCLAETFRLAWHSIHAGRADPYPAWKISGHHNAGRDDYIDLARHMIEAALSARTRARTHSTMKTVPSPPQDTSAGGTDAS